MIPEETLKEIMEWWVKEQRTPKQKRAASSDIVKRDKANYKTEFQENIWWRERPSIEWRTRVERMVKDHGEIFAKEGMQKAHPWVR